MKQRKYKNEWCYFRENMKIVILLSSIALVSATSLSPPPKSVNVAMETSFLFERKNSNDNLAFINNIKGFLDKLYKILETPAKSSPPTRQFRSEPNHRRFSIMEFIQNAGETLLNHTKIALNFIEYGIVNITADAKSVIVDALVTNKKNITYKPTKAPDYDWRSINSKDLRIKEPEYDWRRINSKDSRIKVAELLKKYNPTLHSLATKLDNYYTEHDVKKMLKYLTKINRYLKKGIDPSTLVHKLLYFTIVDKYKSLNETAKDDLKKDLKLLSEYMSTGLNKKFKFKLLGPNKNAVELIRRTPEPPQTTLGGTVNVLEESNDHEMDQNYKETNKIFGINKLKKKSTATNEIIVDNVELILQT